MRKIGAWIWLCAKSFLKKRIVYILGICIFMLCIILKTVEQSDANIVGVCLNDAYNYEVLADSLCEYDNYVIYQNEELLINDINTGRCKCGFIIDSRYDDIIINKLKEKPIKTISKSNYVLTEVDKEHIVSSILLALSDRIITNECTNIVINPDDILSREIISIKNEYLQSDKLFESDFYYCNQSSEAENTKLIEFNLNMFISFLVFAAMLLANGEIYSGCSSVIYNSMTASNRYVYLYVKILCEGFIIGSLGLLIMIVCKTSLGLIDVAGIILTVLYSSLWIFGLSLLIKKETIYAAVCPALLLVSLILLPVIFDFSVLFRTVVYLRYLIPAISFV